MIDIKSISSGLRLGEDGIWYAADKTDISYPDRGNETYFEIEDNSFWFQHRNKCILSLVRRTPPHNNGAIFDIGGGNGYVSRELSENGFSVVLVEPGVDGVRNARTRGINQIICATFEEAQFTSKSIPAVGLFDVIEHIEDDITFLQSICSLMMSGGKIYISVPAYSFLWSQEDVLAGHYRRYTVKTLSEKLNQAGFTVNFATYIFQFLPIPIFLLRSIPYRLGVVKQTTNKDSISRDHAIKTNIVRNLLNGALSREIRNIQKNVPMSFGGSCLIVATSP